MRARRWQVVTRRQSSESGAFASWVSARSERDRGRERALAARPLDGNANGRVFNIGSSHEVTVLEIAHAIGAAVGSDGTVEYASAAADDPARRQPDISKMIERYGWEPDVELDDGLRRTVAYFRGAMAETGALVSEAA